MDTKKDHTLSHSTGTACTMASQDSEVEGKGKRPGHTEEDDLFFRQVNVEFLVHELKTPVSIIETGVRLLMDKQGADAQLTEKQLRTLRRVLNNAVKTRDMLAELLEVGRAQTRCFHCHAFQPATKIMQSLLVAIEAGDPALYERIKASETTEQQMAVLNKNGIRVESSATADATIIEQDETKFSHILGNLIQNGLSYRRRHLLIHTICHRNRIAIAVRDDGPGISPEHHETVFQRYKQAMACEDIARNGHGLGLAAARILARSMGGDITVESELGQGALFRLELPIQFPTAEG